MLRLRLKETKEQCDWTQAALEQAHQELGAEQDALIERGRVTKK
jgi:hypothetical protein